jgi:RNA polymerase sigma-70 factor, ECF subfamily
MSQREVLWTEMPARPRALDVIGEHWTLLVVRELMLGPRRYLHHHPHRPRTLVSRSSLAATCKGCMDDRGMSDARLLEASRDDDGAFRVLYDRYAKEILRYHRRRCGDEEAAFDLVAETFAQAWCVRGAFRDEADGSAAPWLYGIARNVLRQSVRRERLEDTARQRLGALEQSSRSLVTPEESWLDGADEVLDSLPAEQRRAVELRIVEDMSYDRVARVLAITPENARTRVHRALKALRQRDSRMTGGMR